MSTIDQQKPISCLPDKQISFFSLHQLAIVSEKVLLPQLRCIFMIERLIVCVTKLVMSQCLLFTPSRIMQRLQKCVINTPSRISLFKLDRNIIVKTAKQCCQNCKHFVLPSILVSFKGRLIKLYIDFHIVWKSIFRKYIWVI